MAAKRTAMTEDAGVGGGDRQPVATTPVLAPIPEDDAGEDGAGAVESQSPAVPPEAEVGVGLTYTQAEGPIKRARQIDEIRSRAAMAGALSETMHVQAGMIVPPRRDTTPFAEAGTSNHK